MFDNQIKKLDLINAQSVHNLSKYVYVTIQGSRVKRKPAEIFPRIITLRVIYHFLKGEVETFGSNT